MDYRACGVPSVLILASVEPNALPRDEAGAAPGDALPARPGEGTARGPGALPGEEAAPATPLADALASGSWTVLGPGQVRVPAPPRRRWGLDVLLLGWLVPGMGQVLTGRKGAGVALLATIGLLFFTGWATSDFACVHPQRHRMEFFAHAMVGSPALLAVALDDPTPSQAGPRARDVGTLYTVVAGLLNLIAVCSALSDLARRGQEERRKHAEAVQLALAVARLQALARRPMGEALDLGPGPGAAPGAPAAPPPASSESSPPVGGST